MDGQLEHLAVKGCGTGVHQIYWCEHYDQESETTCLFVCNFRHEEWPDHEAVLLEARGARARICPRCLILITVHRHYHAMKVESIIPLMAEASQASQGTLDREDSIKIRK